MRKDRFQYLCKEAESGRDAFVRHAESHREGMIASCDIDNGTMLVRTPDSRIHNWDFTDCEDLERPKMGPMS